MMNYWTLIIIGAILLIVGLALMNIPFGFHGAEFVAYLGWALVILGIIVIVVGAIYLVRAHA